MKVKNKIKLIVMAVKSITLTGKLPVDPVAMQSLLNVYYANRYNLMNAISNPTHYKGDRGLLVVSHSEAGDAIENYCATFEHDGSVPMTGGADTYLPDGITHKAKSNSQMLDESYCELI